MAILLQLGVIMEGFLHESLELGPFFVFKNKL